MTTYRGRRAASIENSDLRVTILIEGCHIAEVFDKRAQVNPLWTPPWPSIEPSTYDPLKHPLYGSGSDAKLLAGIMGHNICLDLFGGPSPGEFAAGLTAHGEAPVVAYEIHESDEGIRLWADLPLAQIRFERRISLHGRRIKICETVESLCPFDRPIGWTQHVTLGPPFLERGATRFRASATRSKVYEPEFGTADYLRAGADFDWPLAPMSGPATKRGADLTVFSGAAASSAYTAHLMDSTKEHAFFAAFSPSHNLVIAYIWQRAQFPWMGIWEENHSRTHSPWNSQTLARGMEFGMSPIPESRRQMTERGRLFGTHTFGWLPANTRLNAEFWVITMSAQAIPEAITWPG
jgi:hypothetical protein